MQKNAFIAIVGRPNVGKSSLLNAFLGQKVAIVSEKPQTTRTRITGVLTKNELQMVFIDTPGLHKPRTVLGERMNRAVGDGMADVDGCLLVVEAGSPVSKADENLIGRMKARKIPAVLAINKIDLVAKEKLLSQILELSGRFNFFRPHIIFARPLHFRRYSKTPPRPLRAAARHENQKSAPFPRAARFYGRAAKISSSSSLHGGDTMHRNSSRSSLPFTTYCSTPQGTAAQTPARSATASPPAYKVPVPERIT